MKPLIYIAIINIVGVVLSFLYGFFGGTGGETTEGVFLGIAFVGISTVIICIILIFFQFDLFKSRWYWFLIILAIGIAEASIVDWKTILDLN